MEFQPRFIDIHSHLNFPDYDVDREAVIARMKEEGIATITIGTSLETSQSAVELAEKHDNIFACIGVHPVDGTEAQFKEEEFNKLATSSKVVAVGECGLDYGRKGEIDDESKQKQVELFEKQIDFAVAHDLPLMIHGRNAHGDIIEIIRRKKEGYGNKLRGNAHFFTGTIAEANGYIELDFSISFTGVLTFTHDYDEVVRSVPLSSMMAETDAPYVAPVPFRGKRNEPMFVKEVVKSIASIKEEVEEDVQKAVVENAKRLFAKMKYL